MRAIDYDAAYPSARSPVFGRDVIATSHPLASLAGMAMLTRGGNAVDAAVAAATALTVAEPTGCGIGGDAFAIVWDGSELHGLNSSGRSPVAWTPDRFAGRDVMPRGWDSTTVPVAVAAWAKLARRFERLQLAEVATPAIRCAKMVVSGPHDRAASTNRAVASRRASPRGPAINWAPIGMSCGP
ncbi:MAG: gamma-glutamyltransferase [Roseiarcus sp.]